ncbi:phosphatidylserine decarboxylase [Marasmius tenuissimus]|nr:phosphatidylserine decarboxylase [Marasmius tenuissimus]
MVYIIGAARRSPSTPPAQSLSSPLSSSTNHSAPARSPAASLQVFIDHKPFVMPFKTALKSISKPVRIQRRNTGGSFQGAVSDGEEVANVNKTTVVPKPKKRRRIRNFRRNTALSPNPGENPIVMLRVQVLSCKDLLAKDRNGFSDPYVTVSLLKTRHQTPAIKRTLQPVYKDAIFDFPIYLSLANNIGVLELVVWDKDVLLRKEYLGEVAFPLEDWFGDGRPFAWDDAVKKATETVVSLPLLSTRANTSSQGSVQIRLGFVQVPGRPPLDFDYLFGELAKRSRPSLVSAAPTHGIGTVRSHSGEPGYADDGGISSESDSEDSDEEDDDVPSDYSDDEDDAEQDPETEGEPVVTQNDPLNLETPTPRASEEVTTPTQARSSLHHPSLGLVLPPAPQLNLTPATPDNEPARASINSILPVSHPVSVPSTPPPSIMPAIVAPTPIPPPPPLASTPSGRRLSGIIPRIPKFPTRRTSTPSASVSAPASPALPPPPPLSPSPSPRIVDLNVDVGAANSFTPDPNGLTSSPVPMGTPTKTPKSPGLGIGAVGATMAAVAAGAAISASPSCEEKEKEKEGKKRRFRKSWGSRRNSDNGIAAVAPERSASEGSSEPVAVAAGAILREPSGGSVEEKPVLEQQTPQQKKTRMKRRRVRKEKRRAEFSLGGENDILGIVMLEIQSADDLPRLKNMTRTGWDMDPFVVISFGKKVFRTRVIRHSRNPVWDEKLLFHVRRYETSFKVQLTILDWDKLSSNDYIGDVRFDVKELVDSAPQPDPETGLYPLEQPEHSMKEYTLPLTTEKGVPWEKHQPTIKFRAKYQPYAALRQRFWYQYLKQYDTDDTLTVSHLELTSMLDSLGSTLTDSTINSFFTRFNKQPHQDDLTILETIQCLETELGRPDAEKNRVEEGDTGSSSISATPVLMASDRAGGEIKLEELDFSGPPLSAMMSHHEGANGSDRSLVPNAPEPQPTEPSQLPLSSVAVSISGPSTPSTEWSASSSDAEVFVEGSSSYSSGSASASNNELFAIPMMASASLPPSITETMVATNGRETASLPTPTPTKKSKFRRGMPRRKAKKAAVMAATGSGSGAVTPAVSPEASVERVINVKNCPLCHRPRLSSKAEMDIVTHLAVCASQDWNRVDRIVVGNFVTASQAQRKWYTKVFSKVSSGDYKLGANSANIIVQNRMTGQLEEEKMQVYVRLGMRLFYKGMKSRMEGGRARRLLKSLSIKQGIKYDSPESVKDIPSFIAFHGLNMNEVAEPPESFKTFNQFFYRKLKPGARPVETPEDPYRLVSAADCRMMAFESVNDATRLWIKGREFTVSRLLGDAYKDQAERYNGGALAIFRLAPQDYHRFHSPVDGTIGPMSYISGEYYTVNPQAIRTALDVFGENARKIVPIDSPQFGRVMAVCVGAMMVGTIQTTVEEGQFIKRGEEFGYFAFGGSTIVLLFEPGAVQWDEDLLINGKASLETLVRVGMGVGTGLRKPNPARQPSA